MFSSVDSAPHLSGLSLYIAPGIDKSVPACVPTVLLLVLHKNTFHTICGLYEAWICKSLS